MKKHAFTGILAVSLGVVTLIGCSKEAKTYTIKFTNGNELVQVQHVQEGKPITAPDNPKDYEKDGMVYTFDAWQDADGNKLVSGTTTATKDVEYSAIFTLAVKGFTVTFVDHEGTETKVSGRYGDPIVAPEDPAPYDDEDDKYVHVFEGWYDGTTRFEEGMKFTRDRTFVAGYERGRALEYEVTFLDTDETTVVDTKKITVIKTSLVTPKLDKEPTDPNRTYKWKCEELGEDLYAQEQRITFTKAQVNEYTFIAVEADRDFTVQFLSKSGELVDVQTFNQSDLYIVGPKFVDTPDKYYKGIWKCDDLKISMGEGQEIKMPQPGDYKFEFDQTPIEYVVAEFDYGDGNVEERIVSIENPKFEAPTIEDTMHYDAYWISDDKQSVLLSKEEVTVDPSDFETTVHYTLEQKAINYTWSFVKDGHTVAEVVINKDMTEAYAPHFDEPTKHYDGNWINEETRLSLGSDAPIALEWLGDEYFQDLTLEYKETPHKYEVYFEHPDGKQETIQVNIEDPIKTTPDISLSPDPGKTYKWVNEENHVVFNPNTPVNFFEDITCLEDDLLFKAVQVGNAYTATLNANGGTIYSTEVNVIFGQGYILPVPTYNLSDMKFDGWYNGDTLVPTIGTWSIPDNVTLKAHWVISFDNYNIGATSVDSFNTPTRCNLSVVEDSTNAGEKVLKLDITAFDYGLKINSDYLNAMFADPNVTAVTFMAKTDAKRDCNFRYRGIGWNGTGYSLRNNTYERNQNGWGIRNYWKTFVYTRDFYTRYDSSTDFLIWGGTGQAGEANPTWVEIKNIKASTHPLTEVQPLARGTGFEGGWLRILDDTNPIYYNSGSEFATVNDLRVCDFGSSYTTYFISNDVVSEGNCSLGFKRDAGSADWLSFNISNFSTDSYKVSFDFYSEIPLNSNNKAKVIGDGYGNPFGNDDTWHIEANKWTHFDLDASQVSNNKTIFKFFGSSSFPEFNFYVDNLVYTPIV